MTDRLHMESVIGFAGMRSWGARLSVDEREALKRLRKEVRPLRLEKEILKKARPYFAKEMK